MLGCTPYSEDEEPVKSRDLQEYADWCAEHEDMLNERYDDV